MTKPTIEPIMVPNPYDNGTPVNVEPYLRLLEHFGNDPYNMHSAVEDVLDEMPYMLTPDTADYTGYVAAHDFLVKVRRALS